MTTDGAVAAEPSNADAGTSLRAADEALRAAALMIEYSSHRGAIDRAYFAMFYAASAALVSDQILPPRSEKTLTRIFHRNFIRSGRLEQQLHRQLVKTSQLHERSEYDVPLEIDDADVAATVEAAGAFVQEMRRIVETG